MFGLPLHVRFIWCARASGVCGLGLQISGLPRVSIVVPCLGLTNFIFTILEGNPPKENTMKTMLGGSFDLESKGWTEPMILQVGHKLGPEP